MTPVATRIPKRDPILLRKVRRYIRRHGGTEVEAVDALAALRHSSPREPEKRLAAAMEEAGMRRSAIKLALAGYWSDFKSPLEFPKVELVKLLNQRRRTKLAERVENGEFDG